jgi:hypothetical protein
VAGQLVFPGTPVSSTNKTDRLDLTKIVLKVVELYFEKCTMYLARLRLMVF